MLARYAIVLSLAVALSACTADVGEWAKTDVDPAVRDADLLACRAEATQKVQAEARQPYASARYTYSGARHGLFGPGSISDDSNVRRQIEGEIEGRMRTRWRALFGSCLEARGYRYESVRAK